MLMSRLLKNHGTGPVTMFNQKATYITTILLATYISAFSCNVMANRPAMEEGSVEAEMAEVEEMPETQAQPSAVDIMMQQQSQQQRGDVLQLPATELQPGETVKIKLLDYPRRGMSMNKVQFEYGQPIAISDSVGKPPITRWTYNDRVVYFEYSNVIHVVAR